MKDLTGKVMAEDNCDTILTVTGQVPEVGASLTLGEQDLTFTATNASGNVSTKACPAAVYISNTIQMSLVSGKGKKLASYYSTSLRKTL